MAEASALTPSFERHQNEDAQDGSILFQLPGEIRDRIYDFALAAFEGHNKQYNADTYWARPNFLAPYKNELALLGTCKKVYREAWFKPWLLTKHSFFLTLDRRAPPQKLTLERFQQALQHLNDQHAHREILIDHVRFFAQMFKLEDPAGLQQFLDLRHFNPKTITITIRHTDWWYWERDATLEIKNVVANVNVFPRSTQTIALELESLERKKDQVDSIVDQMKKTWFFKRQDGILLSARETAIDEQRWRGSSTWDSARWVRDEVAPGQLDYYVATVFFTHKTGFSDEEHLPPPDIISHVRSRIRCEPESIKLEDLDLAGVLPTMTAAEAIERTDPFRQRRRQPNSLLSRELEAQRHHVRMIFMQQRQARVALEQQQQAQDPHLQQRQALDPPSPPRKTRRLR